LLDTIVNAQQRLTVWRNFKKQDLELEKIISYIGSIKTTERAFDYYAPKQWPTGWEIIVNSMYCYSGKALLLHDTLVHMGKLDPKNIVWFVADNYEIGQVGLAFSDGVCYYNILPNQTVKRQNLDNYIRVLEKIKHNKLDIFKDESNKT
jgi:hypothetical protein